MEVSSPISIFNVYEFYEWQKCLIMVLCNAVFFKTDISICHMLSSKWKEEWREYGASYHSAPSHTFSAQLGEKWCEYIASLLLRNSPHFFSVQYEI